MWVFVGFTSHYADVTMFGLPGLNVALDSICASMTFFVCCYNLGWRKAYCTIPICIFYYTRGQLSDPTNLMKLYDHSMWHWTGQCFRITSLLYDDFGPKDWRYEITWQVRQCKDSDRSHFPQEASNCPKRY